MDPRSALLCRDDTVLVVVDVQERLETAMDDRRHLPRIELLAEAARLLEVPVLLTEQYPKGLGATVPSLRARLPEVAAIVKESFSCVRDPAFREALAATGRRQAVVVGLEAHVCVCQTALDLLARGMTVHVPHDAVGSRRSSDRSSALARLATAGVTVTSTESVVFELLERAGSGEFRTLSRMLKEIPVD